MITELIAHLNSSLDIPVVYAHTMDPIESPSDEMPIVMVYPGTLAAAESQIDNFVRQEVTQELVCLLACKIESYDADILKLRNAMIGWTRDAATDAAELEASETLDIQGPYIWVREVYTVRYHITQA